MTIDLKDKTVLITGASSGIGKCFAENLAAQGCHLVLIARSKDKLERLAKSLRSQYSVNADAFHSDLSQPESPKKLFQEIQQSGITVDILINNAGFGRVGCFENVSEVPDQELLSVNVNSLVALTHLFLPQMLEKGFGGIINISSTAAFQPIPFLSIYSASKSFVLTFTESLWGELQPRGIRVLCLCPGNTRTEFHERAGVPKNRVFLTAEAEDVVRFGLNVFQKGKRPTAVYGLINRILAQGYRLSPRMLTP